MRLTSISSDLFGLTMTKIRIARNETWGKANWLFSVAPITNLSASRRLAATCLECGEISERGPQKWAGFRQCRHIGQCLEIAVSTWQDSAGDEKTRDRMVSFRQKIHLLFLAVNQWLSKLIAISLMSLCLTNAPSDIKLMDFTNGFTLHCVGLNLFRSKGEIKTQTSISSVLFEQANIYCRQ